MSYLEDSARLAHAVDAVDHLTEKCQYEEALLHIAGHLRGGSYGYSGECSPDNGVVDPLLLREKELRLLLGQASGGRVTSPPLSYPDSWPVGRARMAELYERLIQERYSDIVSDYEDFGPLEESLAIHQYAYSFSRWLLGHREQFPTLCSEEFTYSEGLPLSRPLGAYLALATVRSLHSRVSREAATEAYGALAKFFDFPSKSDFLIGEHLDVMGMLSKAYARPSGLTRSSRAAHTYASLCWLVRSALNHMVEGDFATAGALVGTIQSSESWATPLRFRVDQVRLGIAIASANPASDRRQVEDMLSIPIPSVSIHAWERGAVSAAFEVYLGNTPAHTAAAILADMLLTERIPLGTSMHVFSALGIELLCETVGMGRLHEAGTLIRALAYQTQNGNYAEPITKGHMLAPVLKTWELCSGSTVSLRPVQVAINHGISDLDILNSAHEAYQSGEIAHSAAHIAALSDSLLIKSPLDKARRLLIEFLTVPSRVVPGDFGRTILATLTPALADALFPLLLPAAVAAGARGHLEVSQDILKALLKHLHRDSVERKACLAHLAESYESAYEHWQAAKHFKELLRQGNEYLDIDGGLDSLTVFRLAKNLFLDFKHESALAHVESLLPRFARQGHSSVPKRLELLKMAAISHEALGHFVNAQSVWHEILELLPNDGTQESLRADASYRAGRLAETGGDYEKAIRLYSVSEQAYEHCHKREAAEQSMRRLNFCRLVLQPEVVAEITYSHTSPSFDIRHSVGFPRTN